MEDIVRPQAQQLRFATDALEPQKQNDNASSQAQQLRFAIDALEPQKQNDNASSEHARGT
jgi:hypothetical protein